MSRPLLAVALALCLTTAGCSSLFGGGTPNPPPRTTTLFGELAPGLSSSGFTDRGELTRSHARILQEKSYTFRKRIVERGSNGSVRGRLEGTTRVGSNGSRTVRHAVRNGSLAFGEGDSFELRAWSSASVTVFAQTMDGRTRYQRVGNERALEATGGPTNRDRLYALFTAMNITHVEKIERRQSNTPIYRVVADDLVHPVVLIDSNGFDSVENASLVAVIDTWGLVHRYQFEATGIVNGKQIHRTETVEITDLGETRIRRPPWLSDALSATNSSNVSEGPNTSENSETTVTQN